MGARCWQAGLCHLAQLPNVAASCLQYLYSIKNDLHKVKHRKHLSTYGVKLVAGTPSKESL